MFGWSPIEPHCNGLELLFSGHHWVDGRAAASSPCLAEAPVPSDSMPSGHEEALDRGGCSHTLIPGICCPLAGLFLHVSPASPPLSFRTAPLKTSDVVLCCVLLCGSRLKGLAQPWGFFGELPQCQTQNKRYWGEIKGWYFSEACAGMSALRISAVRDCEWDGKAWGAQGGQWKHGQIFLSRLVSWVPFLILESISKTGCRLKVQL